MRPFRSSFFAAAEGETPPLVQPVSIVYDQIAGLPAGRLARSICAWVGDQDIASHYWRLAQFSRIGATVLLHQPIEPQDFPDRKALSAEVWRVIADGASALYQHRSAIPIGARRPAVRGAGEALPA